MAIKVHKAKPAQGGRRVRPTRPERGPGAAPIHLSRVELRGVRLFDELSFDIPAPPSPDEGQWIVLLGENGSGKTTLLRSLCVALDPYMLSTARRWDVGPRSADDPKRSAKITATLDSARVGAESLPDGGGWHRDRDPDLHLVAYGSTRGNALGGPDRDVPLDETDGLETLFAPNARLVHAETWLRGEALEADRTSQGLAAFVAVKETLSSLLPGGERIELEGREVLLQSPTGERFPLGAMSDGYLTTLGWTIDLIARWAHRHRKSGKLIGDFTKDMPCVVLVDEIDLHLHPRWQLDIIPRLRKAFPRTTFIVTTHNPLTLQGTRPGEVFVLQRDDAGKVSIQQRDVTPGLDADRLLTGDWFGLGSTLDETTLQALDRHRKMLLDGVPESDRGRKALELELRQRLNSFGDTSAERLAQGVVAELLDDKLRARGDITDADRQRVKALVQKRLAALETPPTRAGEARAAYNPKIRTARSATQAPRRRAGRT